MEKDFSQRFTRLQQLLGMVETAQPRAEHQRPEQKIKSQHELAWLKAETIINHTKEN